MSSEISHRTTHVKEATSFGLPWEKEYGYVQAVRVGDAIYLAGQVGHDEAGSFEAFDTMEKQMRQAYANVVKLLARYGATLDNVVDEMIFVTDIDAAFAARVKCLQSVFGGNAVLASTIVQVQRLSFPQLMVEIRCVAKLAT